MKTLWELFFQTKGFKFDRSYKFRGKAKASDLKAPVPEDVEKEFYIEVLPDFESRFSGANQAGRLQILLSGNPKDTEYLAYWIASNVAEKISFHHGSMQLHGGLITGKRIPETPEEAQAVGDAPYYAKLTMEEVQELPSFDPGSISHLNINLETTGLLSQFNTAKRAANPIERYLGFFKIFEKVYCESNKPRRVLQALRESDEIFEIWCKHLGARKGTGNSEITREQFSKILAALIRIRHNCAHLRGKSGYTPNDPRVQSEVEPYADFLEKLTFDCILARIEQEQNSRSG